MSSYLKVLWPIVVGGQIAKAGELIEVTDAEARLLISLGKAEPAEVEAAEVEAAEVEAEAAEVEAAEVEAEAAEVEAAEVEAAEVEAEPDVRTKGKRNAARGL